ncbi:hypothetical protein CLFO_15260 [Clostridium formicaceticum]|uniref:Uncharacterized protein n=1 Tax=Clostridium formicaceticum TaxID=1497 RepID=A0AAC9RMR2_9CLOT|nr:hypothetical protein CLFO_15260 [Clostridium formicaceticum]
MIVIAKQSEVREWYQGFNIQEVEVGYSVCRENKGRRNFKELIITNYNL